MIIKFWGTRGSIPVPGKNTLKYGGNTPCVEIRSLNKEKIVIIDGGSGIRELGNCLVNEDYPENIDIFFSHYHWDHIQGIPFFKPLYDKTRKITFYGMTSFGENVKTLLSHQMAKNYFPITIDDFKAKLDFKAVEPDMQYFVDNFQIETLKVAHPSPTLTYKIKKNGHSIVYMTDNEINLDSLSNSNTDKEFHDLNKELIEFCSGCDYLVHDAMYEESSMYDKKGWGHSSNISLARFSILAEIKKLVLFHYNPDYTDDKIDRLIEDTKKVFLKNGSNIECLGATESLEISF